MVIRKAFFGGRFTRTLNVMHDNQATELIAGGRTVQWKKKTKNSLTMIGSL